MEEKKVKHNKKKYIFIGAIVVTMILAFSYSIVFNADSKNNAKINIPENKYAIKGNELNDFDLYFLQLENENVNKVYSPLSIKYALMMLKEGTSGTSEAELNSLIGSYQPKKYNNSKNMSFGNALFIRDSFKDNIQNSYVDLLKDKYAAEVVYDSFSGPKTINSWISNKTFDLIKDMVTDVSNQDFVLVNALAIDMEWVKKIQSENNYYDVDYAHENFGWSVQPLNLQDYTSLKFNKSQDAKSAELAAIINKYDIVNDLGEENIRKTVKAAYEKYLEEDPCDSAKDEPDPDTYIEQYMKEINSNYMDISSSTDFYFYDNEEVKVFAKDLKKYNGTTLQYVGIMPKKNSLSDYIKNTNAKDINNIVNNLKDINFDSFEDGYITKVYGYIPMFKFNYELNLMKDLNSLGVNSVFDSEKADLSKITSAKEAYINSVAHKADIEFSNDGIKAAAATALGGAGDARCGFDYNYDVPIKEIDLTFDNPYMFIIRDKNSNEVWFTGTVYNPVKFEPYEYNEDDYN